MKFQKRWGNSFCSKTWIFLRNTLTGKKYEQRHSCLRIMDSDWSNINMALCYLLIALGCVLRDCACSYSTIDDNGNCNWNQATFNWPIWPFGNSNKADAAACLGGGASILVCYTTQECVFIHPTKRTTATTTRTLLLSCALIFSFKLSNRNNLNVDNTDHAQQSFLPIDYSNIIFL